MTKWMLAGSSAAAALMIGSAAMAEITPEQVWQDWKTLGASYGQTMTAASETRQGDTLVVQNVKVTSLQESTTAEGTIERIALRETGDGRVEVTMSENYPVTVTTDPPGDDTPPVTVTLNVSQQGLVVTASGDTADRRYDLVADSVTATMDEVPGEAGQTVDVVITANAVTGNYALTGTETKAMESSFAAATVDMKVSGSTAATPESGAESVAMTATLTGVKGRNAGVLPSMVDFADMGAAMRAGFAMDGGLTYDASTFALTANQPDGDMTFTGGDQGGALNFKMGDGAIGYGGASRSGAFSASGASIPFPSVDVAYAESAFDLLMPALAGDAEQPFRLLNKLTGLTVSEDVWALIDPQQTLPRDPATLIIDVDGSAKIGVDLFAPQMAAEGASLGELQSLNVKQLQLTLAGAELTGAGAFTFDNSDTVTFNGVPAPTGKLNLQLVGGNTLLDRLVAIGIVPQDQAMGARMMLGMFARTVEGVADTLTSELEFRDKGFYANGQRLQ